ncbi:MAG: MFS transporter [Bacilli bacterium]|nr:MFS transporter [Bacilli bacterium]
MRQLLTKEHKYQLFIFLSVLATALSEIYIPIVLYNQGFNLKQIFLFFVFKFSVMLLISYFIIWMGKTIKFKLLLIISALLLGVSFYLLSIINKFSLLFFITPLAFALFNQTYWPGRHYYALTILSKDNLANSVGSIVITTQLALIPSAYLGALIIEHWGLKILTIIVTITALISIIPLFYLKETDNKLPINLREVISTTPKNSLFIIGLDQARQLMVIFFPLFIYLKVVETYRYVGIVNVVIGLAASIFVYFFARKIDKTKKDYLRVSILLLSFILFIKLHITNPLLMIIIVFFEGLIARMHMTTITRNIYSLGQNYYIPSFLIAHDITLNLMRLFLLFLAFFFIGDITSFIYLCLVVFLISSIFSFSDKKTENKNL